MYFITYSPLECNLSCWRVQLEGTSSHLLHWKGTLDCRCFIYHRGIQEDTLTAFQTLCFRGKHWTDSEFVLTMSNPNLMFVWLLDMPLNKNRDIWWHLSLSNRCNMCGNVCNSTRNITSCRWWLTGITPWLVWDDIRQQVNTNCGRGDQYHCCWCGL